MSQYDYQLWNAHNKTAGWNIKQWEIACSQLDSQHQTFVQQRSMQHRSELQELQEAIKHTLAKQRNKLDEQLANHKCGLEVASIDSDSEPFCVRAQLQTRRFSTPVESSVKSSMALVRQLRAALAHAEACLTRSRGQCDILMMRLTAAEAELLQLRGRQAQEQQKADFTVITLGSLEEADNNSAARIRRSLAELERRRLVEALGGLPVEAGDGPQQGTLSQVPELMLHGQALLGARGRASSVQRRLQRRCLQFDDEKPHEQLEQKLHTIGQDLANLRNSLKRFHLV